MVLVNRSVFSAVIDALVLLLLWLSRSMSVEIDWEGKFRAEKDERLALKKKQVREYPNSLLLPCIGLTSHLYIQNEIEEQLKKTKAENARLARQAKEAAIAAQVAAAGAGATTTITTTTSSTAVAGAAGGSNTMTTEETRRISTTPRPPGAVVVRTPSSVKPTDKREVLCRVPLPLHYGSSSSQRVFMCELADGFVDSITTTKDCDTGKGQKGIT
jgi:hypothetical protein